jgi:tetratricopeptide (TPR) repeat protein
MLRIQKRHLALFLAALLWFSLPSGAIAQPAADADRLDALFADLAEPGRTDSARIEREISRIWSQSGSAAMDMLLQRGRRALEAGDYAAAVEHFSALIDHAPEFAEGWNARATAFYLMDEYALSIADIGRVLSLNPRHFGALSGLAIMLEDMGEIDYARDALRAVQALNPNRPNIDEAVMRLNRMTGETDL